MKKIFFIISVLFLLTCNKTNPYEGENNPPHIPIAIFPPNDTTDVAVNLNLQWSGGDPDANDKVKYDLYLEANNPDPGLIVSNLIVNTYHPDTLQYYTDYYWKIIATDDSKKQTSSLVWTFKTRPEFNLPPFTPANPTPVSGSTSNNINNIVLQWQGGDPDTFNVIYYDIYFDIISPPGQLIASNQQDTTFNLPLLNYETTYFWQIIARDNYGLQSNGPVWNFTTKPGTNYFSESFDSYVTGVRPPDSTWVIYPTYGTIFISDTEYFGDSGKSCQFIDSTNIDSALIGTTLPAKSIAVLEFAWRVDNSDDYLGMRLYSGAPADKYHLGPQISIRGDSLQYYDSDWNWKFISNINSTSWYKMRIAFDCDGQYYSIYVNDELKVTNAGWVGTDILSLKYLYFLTFDDRTCSSGYVDEIRYYSVE